MIDDKKQCNLMNYFIPLKKLQNDGRSEKIKVTIRVEVFSSLIADTKTSTSLTIIIVTIKIS